MTFTPYILLACFLAGNAACAQTPGRTAQAMERAGFVDVRSMDSTIRVSLMYARADNFTGRVLYTDLHEAYLHPKAARAFSSSALALASLSRVRDTASSTWAFTFWKAANSARSDIENLRINGWSLRKSST